MISKVVKIGDIPVGGSNPLVLIAGPCVIESEESALRHARDIKMIAERAGLPFVFKASYDKANRSSIKSFRGPGIKEGLKMLQKVRDEVNVPVLSDVHTEAQVDMAAEVLDVIQVPAFLSRQTDLLIKVARTGKPVNVKKGQFMSPEEMKNVVNKLIESGTDKILLTERGTTFGYNMLINDFRAITIMAGTGFPVIYDATHSVQRPGGKGTASGGDAEYVFPLSKAAVAYGVDALFLEVHESPDTALSDGPNMVRLSELEDFLKQIKRIEKAVR